MENTYDMDALYLYTTGWGWKIGRIEKVNTKSVRMQYNNNIKKEDFHKAYKLTEEETNIYNRTLIKSLAGTNGEVVSMVKNLKLLKEVLSYSEFINLNSTKLQEYIDQLTERLSKELPDILNIDGKQYKACMGRGEVELLKGDKDNGQ